MSHYVTRTFLREEEVKPEIRPWCRIDVPNRWDISKCYVSVHGRHAEQIVNADVSME